MDTTTFTLDTALMERHRAMWATGDYRGQRTGRSCLRDQARVLGGGQVEAVQDPQVHGWSFDVGRRGLPA